jgi:hypothetical protein
MFWLHFVYIPKMYDVMYEAENAFCNINKLPLQLKFPVQPQPKYSALCSNYQEQI